MLLTYQESISAADDIEVLFPIGENQVMSAKRDFTLVIAGIGGHTGSANVTMSVKVYADIGPFIVEDESGNAVSSAKWVDVTPAVYRLDTNALGASSFDFVGLTEATVFLDLDNLNADRIKLIASFNGIPAGTPAQLLIKARRDSI